MLNVVIKRNTQTTIFQKKNIDLFSTLHPNHLEKGIFLDKNVKQTIYMYG
jgi:hypothetical protein